MRRAADGKRARRGGDWTADKLEYLRKYAAAFMRAMGPHRAAGKWTALVFFDLLCGPGIDIINGQERPGSPLIALTTVPKFDRLYLGDNKKSNVGALRSRIAPEDAERVDLEVNDCHERAKSIVTALPTWGTLGFAFIDPEGFEVRFDLFQTFAKRPIDLLFLFPSGIGINRNLARFAKSDECEMDRLWGGREWRQLPIVKLLASGKYDPAEADQLDKTWVQAFAERVGTLGYSWFNASPPLCTDTNTAMYHLLFFSKNQAGLDIWNGISQIEPDGQRRLKF